jgi:glycolate oxidase
LAAVLPDNEEQVQGSFAPARAWESRSFRAAPERAFRRRDPAPDGVLLVLSKMRAFIAIDPLARTATVEPGVRNLQVSERAAPHGLFYAPDPSSQSICSIGGNVAENSGGVHCLKYGLTTHNVLAVRAVDADGDVLAIGSEALDAPGTTCSRSSTAARATSASSRVSSCGSFRCPSAPRRMLAAFPSVRQAAEAVGEIIGAGIIPAALEMMDRS